MSQLIISISSFTLTLLLTCFFIPFFKKYIIDIPNNRSSHKTEKPTGGGLFFSLINIISSLFFGSSSLIILLPITLAGFIDDVRGLKAFYRFLIQIITSILIIYYSGLLSKLYLNIESQIIFYLILLVIIIFAAATINFVNFMDGLDGLVCGSMIVFFVTFSIKFDLSYLTTASSLLGFLVLNWSPAKIFMGDVGSTFIGSLYVLKILQSNSIEEALGLILICSPIYYDAISCLFLRIMRRENIFSAHKSHFYQKLYQSGWSHSEVSLLFISLSIFLSIIYLNFSIIVLGCSSFIVFIFGIYLNKKLIKI